MSEIPTPQTPREERLEELFVSWVGLGQGRNIATVAKNAAVPTTELVAHAKKFGWHTRLTGLVKGAEKKTMELMEETIAQVNLRHVNRLREMQTKAYQALENMVIDKPADAIRLLTEATKMERDILGLKDHQNDALSVLTDRLEKLKLIDRDAKPEFEFKKDFKAPELPAIAENEP